MKAFRNKRDINRLNEIIRVLIKYGFKPVLQNAGLVNLPLHKYLLDDNEEGIVESSEDAKHDIYVRIRMAFQELGTTFIKLGQTMSTYPNMVGPGLAKELTHLQDDTIETDYHQIKKIIEDDFDAPIEEVFDVFVKKPIASASIGQVHSAYINNEHVAVKVQHPGIHDYIESDIRIMRYLANLLDKRVKQVKYFNLPGMVDEFERDIYKELDYQFEAKNISHFAYLLRHDDVHIPKLYPDKCTDNVLTMEYLEGVSLNTLFKYKDAIFDKKTIASKGANSYFKQILVYGFFHADPHPGNIFVIGNDTLAFVDFGMVGHLDDQLRADLAKLFIFISNWNLDAIIKQLTYMDILTEDMDIRTFKYDFMDLLDKYYDADLNDITGVLRELVNSDLLDKYNVSIPKELMLVIRTITMVEDIGLRLDPDFDTTKILKSYSVDLIINNSKPKQLLTNTTENIMEMEHLVHRLPRSLNKLISSMNEGKVKIALEYNELNKVISHASRITNQLSLTIITAALIIGSSLVMQTNKGILLLGYPFLGIIGFLFSMILGIAVVIMIIKKGNY